MNNHINIVTFTDISHIKGLNAMAPATVADLRPGLRLTLRGLVIARAGPRKVEQRARTSHLTTVTLRDVAGETINLVIWSNTVAEAVTLEQRARVGCVVDVALPTIAAATGRPAEANDPLTTSPLRLKFVAAVSKLQFVAGPEVAELENLLAQPYRAVGLPYLGLDDVRKRENRGKFISIVAVVQCVLPEVVVGSRKIIVVRLFDDDAPTSVLKLWEPEQRRVAATWLPRETVLLLSNVLVELDQYWGVQVLAGSSRSVITTDPDMWEARHLRHHAHTAAFAPWTDWPPSFPAPPSSLTPSSR